MTNMDKYTNQISKHENSVLLESKEELQTEEKKLSTSDIKILTNVRDKSETLFGYLDKNEKLLMNSIGKKATNKLLDILGDSIESVRDVLDDATEKILAGKY